MEAALDFLASIYLWTLSLHVISVIAWMAGIFYLPRLFVYHVEKVGDHPDMDPIFCEMERKLLRVIMNPAMIGTWVFGLLLVATPGIVDWSSIWPWVKAAMVLGMSAFHHALARWRKDFAAGRNERSGKFYRIANEAPTLMMFVIVIMVIVKPL